MFEQQMIYLGNNLQQQKLIHSWSWWYTSIMIGIFERTIKKFGVGMVCTLCQMEIEFFSNVSNTWPNKLELYRFDFLM